jgi:large subunit ribosomal protein L4
MPTVAVMNNKGSEVEKLDLNAAVFDAEISADCVRAAVNRQLARRRQGTAATKGRSDVRGSQAKPWRQKGTGRARAGTVKSPIWRGGGVVFGPQPRQYGGQVNRKVLRRAIISCLTALARDGELLVVDNLDMPEIKTRQVMDLLVSLKIEGPRVLFLTEATNVNLALSARNIPGVDVINCENINTFDLTTHDVVIASSAAVKRLEEVYSNVN